MARCYDNYRNYYYTCNSAWSNWGRWVLFAVLVGGAILIFLAFSCITARRRRRAGNKPFYGTGWASGGGVPQYQQNPPQPYYNNSNNGPPAYPSGANQDYYGPQGGVPLQQPQQAYNGYRSADVNPTTYDPPKGAPPSNR